jgi:hypothetical protein
MIESLPLPPVVSEAPGPVNAEEAVKRSVNSVLKVGPGILNDDYPCSFVIKTTGHTVLVAFNIEGEELDVSNTPEWLDAVLTTAAVREPVQTISLVVPMAHQVIVQAWDASGATCYLLIVPGPIPGHSLELSPLHNHMPPEDPENPVPEGENLLLNLITLSGRHFWGPAWALAPQTEGSC